jgi:hypothetical protein
LYNDIKTGLSDFLGISKDALHLHIGLALFFALAIILRRGPASILPWLGVLAFELVNEALDLRHNGLSAEELVNSTRDLVNTMVWPTVALVAFRAAASRKRTASRQS